MGKFDGDSTGEWKPSGSGIKERVKERKENNEDKRLEKVINTEGIGLDSSSSKIGIKNFRTSEIPIVVKLPKGPPIISTKSAKMATTRDEMAQMLRNIYGIDPGNNANVNTMDNLLTNVDNQTAANTAAVNNLINA